ncbi:MAG: M48 family metallopeptidase [Wenzhouxiangella sp.]|jgi:Zn-dependent protease with chaperone function|nr:M48 family metallopeptidase [Wenzhouxiangella sp.]
MNFFERQDKARRQTRWLVALFVLAVIAIILAVNALSLAVFGVQDIGRLATEGFGDGSSFLRQNLGLIGATTLITGSVIGLASLFRSLQLRGGGGEVARDLGGTRVEPDATDPLRRRLHNVVEEMAIASGIPVPEVYVLEQEQGINAFAAGYSTSDAAVAVTRGTLEHLDRDELQGVIAHEFSHIFNGDMRLNIRLIGILFGILVVSIIGRRLLYSTQFTRNSRNAAPAVFLGLAVVVIGYVGLFFGRWIKAAVSRQREYLADASAVQFTRHPDGIGGALKKIGALSASSFMTVDSEEVGHMLFARGMGYQMFATHPPLEKRIKAIDPSFRPQELQDLARRLNRHAQTRQAEAEAARQAEAGRKSAAAGHDWLPLDPDKLTEQIGQPGLEQVFMAAVLASEMPRPLERAAHSDEWCREVICYLLLDRDAEIREQQLLMIARALGGDSEQQVRALAQAVPELAPLQRLPLMEMAFPSLRRRPQPELISFMKLIDDLAHADGRLNVFEYALARLTSSQIEDVLNPARARTSGTKKLAGLEDAARVLMAVLAHHGHRDNPDAARAALAAGLEALFPDRASPRTTEIPDWPGALDKSLKALNALRPAEKQKLVAALSRVVMHDNQVVGAESELLRVICGVLHVPLPPALAATGGGQASG